MFEFSQVEYTVRHYLGEAIGLDRRHFSAVVESYDVGLLVTVAKNVFKTLYGQERGAQIETLLNRFHELNVERKHQSHTDYGYHSWTAVRSITSPATSSARSY